MIFKYLNIATNNIIHLNCLYIQVKPRPQGVCVCLDCLDIVKATSVCVEVYSIKYLPSFVFHHQHHGVEDLRSSPLTIPECVSLFSSFSLSLSVFSIFKI